MSNRVGTTTFNFGTACWYTRAIFGTNTLGFGTFGAILVQTRSTLVHGTKCLLFENHSRVLAPFRYIVSVLTDLAY